MADVLKIRQSEFRGSSKVTTLAGSLYTNHRHSGSLQSVIFRLQTFECLEFG